MNENGDQSRPCATSGCERSTRRWAISVVERGLLGNQGPPRCEVCRNAIQSATQALAAAAGWEELELRIFSHYRSVHDQQPHWHVQWARPGALSLVSSDNCDGYATQWQARHSPLACGCPAWRLADREGHLPGCPRPEGMRWVHAPDQRP